MHGTAFSGRASASLAIQFRHHRRQISVPGQIHGVTPVGASGIVLGPKDVTHSDRHGFLANGQMNRAFYPVAGVNIGNAFFAAPDKMQGTEKSFYIFRAWVVGSTLGHHVIHFEASHEMGKTILQALLPFSGVVWQHWNMQWLSS
tara:strand:- start:110 stop:544 length:435 start_codon:yes stop_codon:yes gene_type:complete